MREPCHSVNGSSLLLVFPSTSARTISRPCRNSPAPGPLLAACATQISCSPTPVGLLATSRSDPSSLLLAQSHQLRQVEPSCNDHEAVSTQTLAQFSFTRQHRKYNHNKPWLCHVLLVISQNMFKTSVQKTQFHKPLFAKKKLKHRKPKNSLERHSSIRIGHKKKTDL